MANINMDNLKMGVINPTGLAFEKIVVRHVNTANCLRLAADWIDDTDREPTDIIYDNDALGNPRLTIYVPILPQPSGGDEDD